MLLRTSSIESTDLESLSTFSVISTDFNSVVVRSSGYRTLSNNNGQFYV